MGLGIGPLELGLVLLVALLVFGPHRLPEMTKTIGRAVAEFRRAVSQVSLDLREEALASTPQRDRTHPTESDDFPSPSSTDPPVPRS